MAVEEEREFTDYGENTDDYDFDPDKVDIKFSEKKFLL